MNAAADLSILNLLTKATLVVQLVMALLVVVSLASWTAIFSKGFTIRRARGETNDFERKFWGGAELSAAVPDRDQPTPSDGQPRAHLRGRHERVPQAARPRPG